jgi:hypothetical protein
VACDSHIDPRQKGIREMQASHARSAVSARFDDPNLVSCAGLDPVMALAESCGLAELVAGKLSVPAPNAQLKVPALVAGMVAQRAHISGLREIHPRQTRCPLTAGGGRHSPAARADRALRPTRVTRHLGALGELSGHSVRSPCRERPALPGRGDVANPLGLSIGGSSPSRQASSRKKGTRRVR